MKKRGPLIIAAVGCGLAVGARERVLSISGSAWGSIATVLRNRILASPLQVLALLLSADARIQPAPHPEIAEDAQIA
jgi:hypothetical protein